MLAARGLSTDEALRIVLRDRPQAQPNPLVILRLDEVLKADGSVWYPYHRWAYDQPWWVSRLKLDKRRTLTATREALLTQTHRKRPRGAPRK